MPCGTLDHYGDCGHSGIVREWRKLTRYACAQFKAGRPVPAYLKAWWPKHRQQDRERVQSARARRATRKAKRAALAKLTQAERRALGIFTQ